MITKSQDTIAAIATAPGKGGIGIIRISGPDVARIAKIILGKTPPVRTAIFTAFLDEDNSTVDEGIALYFTAPQSFTGEDVLELQGHGGSAVLDRLLRRVLKLSVRSANPGEFSLRAFLNNKMDLIQAEAIADLIDASSEQAARSAMRSLQGEFSQSINQLITALIQLRMYVEAAIDFPEEEIDFLSDGKVASDLEKIHTDLQHIIREAKKGSLLRDGMTVVIAGKPNAGKSSLLNRLSGKEIAIVTDIPGTTRDLLQQHIHIDGLPLHLIDTAGLRKTIDKVEQEGIRRAVNQIELADRVLLVSDINENKTLVETWNELEIDMALPKILTWVRNKIDLQTNAQEIIESSDHTQISLSAKTGAGVELLREHLKKCVGYEATVEGNFMARSRHLHALSLATQHLIEGQKQLLDNRAGELLAEELRLAQQALSEITGQFHSDDLLGKIFSSFCIGK